MINYIDYMAILTNSFKSCINFN